MDAGDGIYGRQVSMGVSSKEYAQVNQITGDEPIVFSLIGKVADFILNNNDDRQLSQAVRSLRARPVNLEKCKAIKQIIDAHPLISVVDDVVNKHEATGTIMIGWERSLNIDDEQVLAIMGEEGLNALKQSERTSIDILTVSKISMRALMRLTETLERPVYRPIVSTPSPYRTLPTNPTYTTPLFNTPKKRDCDCAII